MLKVVILIERVKERERDKENARLER